MIYLNRVLQYSYECIAITPEGLQKQFHKYITQGELKLKKSKDHNSSYNAHILSLMFYYPCLHRYMASHPICMGYDGYTPITGHHIMVPTLAGIGKIMELLDCPAPIVMYHTALIRNIEAMNLGEKKAFICTKNVFEKDDDTTDLSSKAVHTLALFIEKSATQIELFVIDNEGGKKFCNPHELISHAFAGKTIKIAVLEPARIDRTETTCQTYAVTDCLAFYKEPTLLDQIRSLNPPPEDKTVYRFDKIPDPLRSLEKKDAAKYKYAQLLTLLLADVAHEHSPYIPFCARLYCTMLLVIPLATVALSYFKRPM